MTSHFASSRGRERNSASRSAVAATNRRLTDERDVELDLSRPLRHRLERPLVAAGRQPGYMAATVWAVSRSAEAKVW